MSGLQDFLQQRRQTQANLQRQERGNKLRMVVPLTKLEHPAPQSRESSPGQGTIVDQPLVLGDHGHQSGLLSNQTPMEHATGFDTDAEGLDDTITTSDRHDSGYFQAAVTTLHRERGKDAWSSGFDKENDFLVGSSHQHYDNKLQHFALGNESLVVDGECESYEQSADEDKLEREVEGEEEFAETVEPRSSAPSNSQLRPGEMPFVQEKLVKEITQGPFMHDHLLKKRGDQVIEEVDPLQLQVQSIRSGVPHSEGNEKYGDPIQALASNNKTLSTKFEYTKDRPVIPLLKFNLPSSLQRTVPVNLEWPQPLSASRLKSQSLQPHPHEAFTEKDLNEHKADSHALLKGRVDEDVCLPNFLETHVGADNPRKHRDKETQSNDIDEANLSLGIRGLNQDHYFIRGNPDVEMRSELDKASKPGEKIQKRPRDLDYNLDRLASMDFEQLRDEAFHVDPRASGGTIDITGDSLAEKLSYLVKLEASDSRISQQGAFLNSLPIEDFEECGDLIVERFSHLVKKMKIARQERRKAAKEFEGEIAKREENVRRKIDAFEKDFHRLKRSGEDVIKKRLAT